MSKFAPVTAVPTDQDLVDLLATRGMGWQLYPFSVHRPGARPIPHAWRWPGDRPRVMVYCGGTQNVEFAPLDDEGDAVELRDALAAKDIKLDGWDLATADGRRAFCEAAGEQLKALPTTQAEPPAQIGPATFTTDQPVPPEWIATEPK